MGGVRALLPEPAEDVDVHEHYATGWLDRGGIRLNMLASLDGAATVHGLSEGLQTPADNRVFAALRDLADVVFAGAGTVRAEGYRPIELGARRAALRRRYGLAAALPTAVISRSLDLDPNAGLFANVRADARPIVLTCAAADPDRRVALARVADVCVCGQDAVELSEVRRVLAERGLARVLCEGGPTLFAELAGAGEVDDLCLSVSPLLAGPGAQRISAGAPWDGGPRRLRLHSLLEEDGALFLRLAGDPVAG